MSYGTFGDVKKEITLIPATPNVKIKVDLKMCDDTDKNGNPRMWLWFNPTFTLIEGVNVKGETKFKGKTIFGDMVCYFADLKTYQERQAFKAPGAYDYVADLKKLQHLVDLKMYLTAMGAEDIEITEEIGISQLTAAEISERIKAFTFLGDVKQVKDKETGELKNIVTNIKSCPMEDLV